MCSYESLTRILDFSRRARHSQSSIFLAPFFTKKKVLEKSFVEFCLGPESSLEFSSIQMEHSDYRASYIPTTFVPAPQKDWIMCFRAPRIEGPPARRMRHRRSAELSGDELTIVQKGTTMTITNGDKDVVSALKVIDHMRRNSVKEVVFNKCCGKICTLLTVVLSTFQELESLSIFMMFGRSESMEQIAYALGVGLLMNPNIRKLEIGIASFANYFSLSHHASRSLSQGLAGNKTLRILHMDGCRFEEPESFSTFCKGLKSMTSLRHVRFEMFYEPNGSPLADHNVAALARSLEHCSKLQALSLKGNKCLDFGMIAVASLLERTPIKRLNIGDQKMDQNEYMNTYHLVKALGNTTSLEVLDLRSNNLSTDYDMGNLAAALDNNTSVKRLNISYNQIRSSAMNILSSRLASLEFLEELWMEGMFSLLDDEACQNLANAMNENQTIRLKCDPKLLHYETIQYYADLNWAGRRFIEQCNTNRDAPPIPTSLWPLVLSRTNKLKEIREATIDAKERQANIIFYCLQKGTAIFPI